MKWRILLVAILVGMLAGCSRGQAAATPTAVVETGGTRLRITNAGSVAIQNLTVIFPDEEIVFGDVAAGATTEYMDVRSGVYGYAAYRYELDGEQVTQPVIDWVGEEGKQGWFTYMIDFDPARAAMQRIMQQSVVQDR